MKHQMKECKKHGLVKHRLSNRQPAYYRCSKCSNNSTKYRRLKRRKDLIEYAGGKCSKCGYNKYSEVLEFHHKDPSQKLFDISSQYMNKYSTDILKKEADKCDLLCANCHREIHVELKPQFKYEPRKYRESIKCATCGKTTKNNKYCSSKCFAGSRKLEKPTKEDLKQLLNEYTYLEIARQFNVASSLVFKWTQDYGLTNIRKRDKIQT